MICDNLFNLAPLFTALSDTRSHEIQQCDTMTKAKLYKLDLYNVINRKTLCASLLSAFDVQVAPQITDLSSDGCLDGVWEALTLRPASRVLLAVSNANAACRNHFQQFLDLLDLLSGISRAILHFSPSGARHRVLLRVVFFGQGPNYPEELDWL